MALGRGHLLQQSRLEAKVAAATVAAAECFEVASQRSIEHEYECGWDDVRNSCRPRAAPECAATRISNRWDAFSDGDFCRDTDAGPVEKWPAVPDFPGFALSSEATCQAADTEVSIKPAMMRSVFHEVACQASDTEASIKLATMKSSCHEVACQASDTEVSIKPPALTKSAGHEVACQASVTEVLIKRPILKSIGVQVSVKHTSRHSQACIGRPCRATGVQKGTWRASRGSQACPPEAGRASRPKSWASQCDTPAESADEVPTPPGSPPASAPGGPTCAICQQRVGAGARSIMGESFCDMACVTQFLGMIAEVQSGAKGGPASEGDSSEGPAGSDGCP